MYNRYVPQSDGSFQRNAMPDSSPPPRAAGPPAHYGPLQAGSAGVSGFFRQLLPKDFSTEDLLVVILLLLMSGNSKEDQNYALLTLALYLFL